MKNDIDIKLIEDIINHNCIFFLGAGVSASAGLPGSEKLAEILSKKLIKYLKKEGDEENIILVNKAKLDLQRIAGYYHNTFRDHKIKIEISNIISLFQEEADTGIFDIISKLPRNDFITTNYDEMLEDAIERNIGIEDRKVIWKKDQLSEYNHSCYNILKIHGTVTDPPSIVVLPDDYSCFKQSNIYKFLLNPFQIKTLIIVGYSALDSDFRDLYFDANSEKDIYLITNKYSQLLHEEWRKKGSKIIERDAKDFFSELVERINNWLKEYPTLEIRQAPREYPKAEDCNPFKYYTTDGLAPKQFVELISAFVPPAYADFGKIYNTDKHHIVQGSRGCGKTVLLRSLSIELPPNIKEKRNFIAFWIPLSTKFLGCVKRYDMDEKKWYKFFSSYLNVLIIEYAFNVLIKLDECGDISFDDNLLNEFINTVTNDINVYLKDCSLKALFNEISRLRGSYHTAAYEEDIFRITVDPNYLRRFACHLQKLDQNFSDKYIFVILDDVHWMDEDQKRVLVSFINQRIYPLSFKIGTKNDFGVYKDFFGATIQEGKDYEILQLDYLLGKQGAKSYYSFLKNVANKRLEVSNQKIDISKLLPKGKNKKRGETYSGFNEYVRLSSQIVRDFITLMKDTVYVRYPDIVTTPIKLKPIPSNVQNEVIFMKSGIHFFKALQEAGELRDELHLLIETLGKLFKRTLELSTKKGEPRTVSGIEIDDYRLLDPKTKMVLEKGIELQLLQRPMRDRIRQPYDLPFFGLKFHRLLIPHYRLRLGYRYPRTVNYKLLDYLICGKPLESTLFPGIKDLDNTEKRQKKFIEELMKTMESEKENQEAVQLELDLHLEEI